MPLPGNKLHTTHTREHFFRDYHQYHQRPAGLSGHSLETYSDTAKIQHSWSVRANP